MSVGTVRTWVAWVCAGGACQGALRARVWGASSDGKVWFSLVQYPKFVNNEPNHLFHSAVFWNLEQNVAFRFKKHSVHVRTVFKCKRKLGSTGRSMCTSVVWQRQVGLAGRDTAGHSHGSAAVGGCGYARGGGELAHGWEEGHTVEELLVELRAARVVVQGNRTYWQGISRERGHTRGDALIVYSKGLVLKRF